MVASGANSTIFKTFNETNIYCGAPAFFQAIKNCMVESGSF
jgi:hypothetical protein